MTSTYSSGAYTDQKIATTDNGGGCTVSHTGTSAAAPLAAGILALVLEARPDLTWRDVQHLVVYSSNPGPVINNPGWRKNGAGLSYNPRFGFGILDAETIVNMALVWRNVAEKTECVIAGTKQNLGADTRMRSRDLLTDNDVVEIIFNSNNNNCGITSLEHVQAVVNIDHPVRGQLEILLISPSGH